VSDADRSQLTGSSWTDEDPLIGRGARSRGSLGQSVFIALTVLFIVHGVVIATAGMLGRLAAVMSTVWPVEIFWLALLFSLVQRVRPKVGLLIAAVPALVVGALFSYFAVTRNWHEWWWWLFAAVASFSVVIAMATRPNRTRVIEASATIQILVASALSLATILFGFLRPNP
jgi:hypothetical protein